MVYGLMMVLDGVTGALSNHSERIQFRVVAPDSLPANSVHISHDGMDHGFFLQCSQTDPLFDGPVIE